LQKFEIRSNFTSFLQVFGPKSGLKSKNSKFRFKDLMRLLPRNIPMKFHCSNMKTEGGVCKTLKSGQNLQVFGRKSGLKSKNSKFRFKDLMRTVPRNIPMKLHRSNMKTEGGVRKSLSADAADADSIYY
jgi:hypothetical protein